MIALRPDFHRELPGIHVLGENHADFDGEFLFGFDEGNHFRLNRDLPFVGDIFHNPYVVQSDRSRVFQKDALHQYVPHGEFRLVVKVGHGQFDLPDSLRREFQKFVAHFQGDECFLLDGLCGIGFLQGSEEVCPRSIGHDREEIDGLIQLLGGHFIGHVHPQVQVKFGFPLEKLHLRHLLALIFEAVPIFLRKIDHVQRERFLALR